MTCRLEGTVNERWLLDAGSITVGFIECSGSCNWHIPCGDQGRHACGVVSRALSTYGEWGFWARMVSTLAWWRCHLFAPKLSAAESHLPDRQLCELLNGLLSGLPQRGVWHCTACKLCSRPISLVNLVPSVACDNLWLWMFSEPSGHCSVLIGSWDPGKYFPSVH